MKRRLATLAAALALTASTMAIQPAHAAHFGVAIGVPIYGLGVYSPYYGPYYGYPYYPPAVVAVRPAPSPTYVEQQPATVASSAPSESGYWYYCKDPAGYYPIVKICPAGWQKVAPLPGH